MTQLSGPQNAIRRVVDAGLCIGCGLCTTMCPEHALMMAWYAVGIHQAKVATPCRTACGRCERVCPFSNACPNEDELSQDFLGDIEHADHQVLGRVSGCYVVADGRDEVRSRSASGGAVTWALEEALLSGLVDRVATVRRDSNGTQYRVCEDPIAIRDCAGSFYTAVRVDGVIDSIRQHGGRWAVVAVPCVAKGLRAACAQDRRLRDSLVLLIGLTCGQTKTGAFGSWVAYTSGSPGHTVSRFRVKDPSRNADDFAVELDDGRTVHWRSEVAPAWHARLFTPPACGVCDDLFAETADMTAMDAWLPEYTANWRGTSLVIERSAVARRILSRMSSDASPGVVEPCGVAMVERSQRGPERDKRVALAYRLAERQRRDLYTPTKRVRPARVGWILDRAMWRVEQRNSEASFVRMADTDAMIDWTEAERLLRRDLRVRAANARLRRMRSWLGRAVRRVRG